MSSTRALAVARYASLVAAVLAIPVVILDERGETPLVHAANWVLWAVFAFELALTAGQQRWRTIRDEPLLVVLVVLTIPIAPPGLQVARVLRFVPLLRLFGAAHLARRVFSLEGLHYAAVILAIVVVGGGALLPVLEPGQRLSTQDGIWWAIVTVTTVGYGDIVPHTEAGRVLGTIVMVTGIGTAALLIGAAAQRFTAGSDEVAAMGRKVDELTAAVDRLRLVVAGEEVAGRDQVHADGDEREQAQDPGGEGEPRLERDEQHDPEQAEREPPDTGAHRRSTAS